jgi:hypothetical protein
MSQALTGGQSQEDKQILHNDVSTEFMEKMNMNKTMSNFSQD